MKKLLILLFSLLFISVSALAEPKQLVCIDDPIAEADRLAEAAEQYADPNYVVHDMETSREFKLYSELCRQATFGWKRSYIFDTEGLNDSTKDNAEYTESSCHGTSTTREAQLSATPNIISFSSNQSHRKFNVDRKTLKGGIDAMRDFQCEVRDLDTSDNLI